jgi:nitrous oxidase accessory protein NosD
MTVRFGLIRLAFGRVPWMLAVVLAGGGFAFAEDASATVRAPGLATFTQPILGPTVITHAGSYVLVRNISMSGSGTAIRIAASNVTLDLNGHTLTGSGATQGTGVSVTGVSGVRIHSGIVSRFGTGIEVSGSSNVTVEGLQISGTDAGGPAPGEVGILLRNSRAVALQKNRIARVFLGIFVRGGGSGANRIAENVVAGGQNGQLGICYNPDGSADPDGPTGDLVYNNLVSRFQIGIQTSAGTSGNIFRENDLAYVQQGIQEVTPGSNAFAENTEVQIGL